MTPDLERLHRHRDLFEDAFEVLEIELADAPGVAYVTTSGHRSKRARRDLDALAVAEAIGATKALVAWWGRDREGLLGLWRGPDHVPLERAPIVRLGAGGHFELVALRVGDYFVASVDEDMLDEIGAALDAAGLLHAPSADAVWRSIESLPSPNDHRDQSLEAARLRRGLDP